MEEPLEFLGPPQVIIQEARVLVNGVVVDTIQDFGRTVVTLNALTPTETKTLNAMDAMQMRDPLGSDQDMLPGGGPGGAAAPPPVSAELRADVGALPFWERRARSRDGISTHRSAR